MPAFFILLFYPENLACSLNLIRIFFDLSTLLSTLHAVIEDDSSMKPMNISEGEKVLLKIKVLTDVSVSIIGFSILLKIRREHASEPSSCQDFFVIRLPLLRDLELIQVLLRVHLF